MSWFPQGWRTRRNAIRSVIRANKWIIKSLNAYGAPGNPGSMPVWESPHQSSTPSYVFWHDDLSWSLSVQCFLTLVTWSLGCWAQLLLTCSSSLMNFSKTTQNWGSCKTPNLLPLILETKPSSLNTSSESLYWLRCMPHMRQTFTLSTSDQTTIPAEFKHIIKQRKRNQQGFP